MCDVCREEEIDWKFKNGTKPSSSCRLYRIYRGQSTQVMLCHLHSIELFCIGETRFLKFHPRLAMKLHTNVRSSSSDVFAFS